ncbi:MAG: flagellar basal body L-ring protein FlgH [bacterium]
MASLLHADSLWTSQQPINLFSDVKARRKGDIVLLTIPEDVKIAAEVERDEANTTAHPDKKYPFIKKALDRLLQRTQYSFPIPYHSPETTYPQTNVSMQVMDVLPNGNLVLEGVRKYKFWDTYKYEVIRGIIRSVDIEYDNSISLDKVSRLTIDYATGNSFEDAKRNGLITNLNNLLDPY